MSQMCSFWSTLVCTRRAHEVDCTSHCAEQTLMRMAELVPMEMASKIKKHPCLKIIVCPVAFHELHINCVALASLSADLAKQSLVSDTIVPRKGLSTADQARSSAHTSVSFIKTGESTMTSTEREPER